MTSDDFLAGTRGRVNAPIMIVGEAWGQTEREQNKPFVGPSGYELKSMLAQAGISPDDCFYTNLVNVKPNANDMRTLLLPNARGEKGPYGDGIRPGTALQQGLNNLDRQIDLVQPRLIITCGNWPLWYLTRKAKIATEDGYKTPSGVATWRGSQLFLADSPTRHTTGTPVLPIYHPAAILRMYVWRQITVQDLRRAARYLSGQSSWHPRITLSNTIRPDPTTLNSILRTWMSEGGEIVCDIETKGGLIHMIGLSRDGVNNLCVPFFELTATGFKPCYDPATFRDIYLALYEFLRSGKNTFVGQNFIYDLQYLIKFFHCVPVCSFDTMVAQHVLFPALRRALDYMASMYCEHYVYWKDDLKESTDAMDLMQACEYNCVDLYRTQEVAETQRGLLQETGKRHLFDERMQVFDCCLEMMVNGIAMDEKERFRQRMQLIETAHEIAGWLDGVMPIKVDTKSDKPWYNSSQQLAHILYDRMKLRVMYKKKKKGEHARTTDKEALAELSKFYPEYSGLFSAILLLRSVNVVAGNFLSARLDPGGRMCTSYNVAGPVTYRLASSKNVWDGGANFQNIPRDREDMDLFEQDLI